VSRHRIVKQNPRKAHVECDPFDEAEWERLNEPDSASDEFIPRSRTVAVDRLELRREGRFQCGRSQGGQTFYATEDAAIRDVEATLTAKYDWCATLGVEFPCSKDEIKAAYRRLALSSHPDRGGDPAEFRRIEQAHREALAYFS
jgi:DnaJ-domain-containing protein 1